MHRTSSHRRVAARSVGPRRPFTLATIALVALVAAAGCSDGQGTGTSASSSTLAPTTSTSSTLAPTTSTTTSTTVAEPSTIPPTSVDPAQGAWDGSLQSTLELEVPKLPASPGQLASVRRTGFAEWHGAVGVVDRASGEPLSGGEAVRYASLTKTFVAAAILRLVENGTVELDQPIATVLPDDFRQLLVDGGYDPDTITIRHLLEHTSGIADYWGSETGAASSPYAAAVAADPARRWTPQEQVQFAMTTYAKQSEPGAEYHYSDTGYVLLAQIMAAVTNRDYPAAMRELLDFDGLGLTSLHVEQLEPAPPGQQRAHQYTGDQDTFDVDPSYDVFGGGGLVGTMSDLTGFLEALFTGRVFDDPATLALMTSATVSGESPYGLGTIELGGVNCHTNSGALGEFFFVCPDADVITARSVNQSVPPADYDLTQSFEANAIQLAVG